MNKTILHPEYNELVNTAINWEYGTVHTHVEIANIMRLEPNSTKYYSAVTQANKRLLDLQKKLITVRKIGYKVMEPTEYSKEAVHQLKLSKNRSKQAVKVAVMAPIDKMSSTEQMIHRQITDRSMAYHAHVSGAVVESKLLLTRK